jgi:anti-sigma factor ChrR (cupin superfamily)
MSRSKPPKWSVRQEEDAALAALGFLTPSESVQAPTELIANLREAASMLALSASPVVPASSVKERLLRHVANFETLKPLADVRRDEDAWAPSGVPGVDIKPLYRDRATGRSTALIRMAPGTSFPAHFHHDDEQCLVVSGDIGWGEIVYREGDFVVMGKDTAHPEIRTEHGNMLLIVAGRNEFLPLGDPRR